MNNQRLIVIRGVKVIDVRDSMRKKKALSGIIYNPEVR